MTIPRDLLDLAGIAFAAGHELHRLYATGCGDRTKADGSPVTEADEAAERLILEHLAALDPGSPVIAEEAVAAGGVAMPGARFWCVDPLDGTANFIARDGEFTVNIARIDGGVPVLGVIDAPVLGEIFVGGAGAGAWRARYAPDQATPPPACAFEPIMVRAMPERPVVLRSRRHGNTATDRQNDGFRPGELRTVGSSLKFCRIATGEADIYARMDRLAIWDIAAGHALVVAAGGTMRFPDQPGFAYAPMSLEGVWDHAAPPFIAAGAGGPH
jgi:3'(2'),5'-bisphosphate nucleotidase